MSLRTALLALPLALVLVASLATAQSESTVSSPATADFQRHLTAMLEASKAEGGRGLMFHVDGQAIGGKVVEIGNGYVVVRNQEYSRILIRLDQVDAVAGN